MEIRIAFASSFDEWAWGYGRGFELLGWTALCIGPLHVSFETHPDKYLALETPWTAFGYWVRERVAVARERLALLSA